MHCLRRAVAVDLIDELCGMVVKDPNRDTEDEDPFLREATKGRTMEIGKWLHDRGGKNLMLEAYLKVRDFHGMDRAEMLDHAWDGIGSWRA
jgi:hypothetical protein